MVLGRSHAVVELAVVGNQQHAGGIRVQPADRLHIEIAQVGGKQRKHTRPVARLVRRFVACGLVQHNIEIRQRHDAHRRAADAQRAHRIRRDFRFRTGHRFAVHLHTAAFGEPFALLAAADALRLQIFDQLHTDTPIKFSDGLFSQKRPPEKSRAKKTAPDNRGAKGTQTTTKNAGLSTLLSFKKLLS